MSSVSKILLKGSFLRVILLILSVGIGFYMMPFLIKIFGDEKYGIWVLVNAIISFYGLIDFGMGSAFQRFLIRSMHGDNLYDTNIALSTSFFLSIAFGLIGLLITIAIIVVAPYIFALKENTQLFRIVFFIIGFKTCLQMPLYTFYGILVARYRYDIITCIQIIVLIARTSLIIYFISHGHGLLTLAIIMSVFEIFSSIAIIIAAKNYEPSLEISTIYFRFEKLKEYFNYGKYVYLMNIAGKIRFSLDELVVGFVISIGAVTHYTIATAIIGYFGALMASIFNVINPVLHKYHKLEQWDNLREIFLILTEITTFLSMLIGGLIIVYGGVFIKLWIGSEYLDSYMPLVILTACAIFSQILSPGMFILLAIAKHQYLAKILMLEALFNLGLSIIFAYYFGMIGIAIGTLIPALINSLVLIPMYTCKQLEISSKKFYVIIANSLIINIILFVTVLIAVNYIKPDNYYSLITMVLLTSIIYILIYFRMLFSELAIKFIFDTLPEYFRILSIILIGKNVRSI